MRQLLLLHSCLAARSRSEFAGSNVLLIGIDTLRADHLGGYGYPRPTFPRIDTLAAEGVPLFSHGTAQRSGVVTAFEVTRVASAFSSRAHHVSRVGQRVLTCA